MKAFTLAVRILEHRSAQLWVSLRRFAGIHAPLRLIAVSLAITFLASILAGIFPSRLAGRIHLPAAIQGE